MRSMKKALVFADSQFCVTDWIDELKIQEKGLDVTKNIETVHQGGNPGPYKETTLRWKRKSQNERPSFYVVQMNTQAQYDPHKMGKMTSLDFTFHVRNISLSPDTKVEHALVIKQNGVYFRSPKAKLSNTTSTWQGFVINDLAPSHFKRMDQAIPAEPPTQPDFAAGMLQFGYAVFVSSRGKEGCEAVSGVDNWRVTVMHVGKPKKERKRFENDTQERQKLEKLLLEEKLNAEQEVRRARLKAEEEVRKMQLVVEKLRRKKERARKRAAAAAVPVQKRETSPAPKSLTRESSEAKSQEYLAVVKAVQTKLKSTVEVHKAEREAWEKAKGELMAKTQAFQEQLDAERKMKEVFESKLTADFEKLSAFHQKEKESLDENLNKQNEVIDQYRLRIQQLEKELAQESNLRRKKEEEIKVLAEDSKEAKVLKGKLEEMSQHCSSLASELAELEAQFQKATRERDEGVLVVAALKDELAAYQKEMEEQIAQLREELSNRTDSEAKLQDRCVELESAHAATVASLRDREQAVLALTETEARLNEANAGLEKLLLQSNEKSTVIKRLFKDTKKNLRRVQESREEAEKVLQEEQEKAKQLEAELRVQIEARERLLATNLAVTEEKQLLSAELEATRSKVSDLEKEAEGLAEMYKTEKELRERVAGELNLAIQERKEIEVKHDVALALANAKLRKQTQLTESLKMDTANIQQLQEELEVERIARMKAEDALKKLEEIFNRTNSDDGEDWELMSDEDEHM